MAEAYRGVTGMKSGFAPIVVIAVAAVLSATVASVTARMHNRSNDVVVTVYGSSNVVVTVTQTAEPQGGGHVTVPVSPTKN